MELLILGAGYAGVRTAIELDRLLEQYPSGSSVTLVDRNLYHQHLSMLHLAATGTAPEQTVAISLDWILRRRNVRFQQGEVQKIEALHRHVVLTDGLILPYDRLVLALGAETNYADVPGAREHTYALHSYPAAMRLYHQIKNSFALAASTADPVAKQALLTFIIVGGGFTGVQLAGELAHWAEQLCTHYQLNRFEVQIVLIERSGALLKQFGVWASDPALETLSRRRIEVLLHTSVTAIEKIEAVAGVAGVASQQLRAVRTQDGQAQNLTFNAATIVWAGGIRAPQLIAEAGLPVDRNGRVYVDRYLRVHDQAAIFALGDCAIVPSPQGQPVLATASYAMRQGEHLAHTLLDEIEGNAPHPYTPLDLGQLVSLGPGAGVGNPLGVPLEGLPIALLKQGVEAWYLTTLEKIF
ncbi:MAG: NAD(P)/FAD-dependent oxidoreductase [Chloroflexaceae bacterium]|nr:NAD(P)/FAD-dependent oxidoreductase [Chloroflexaceae bacterium]